MYYKREGQYFYRRIAKGSGLWYQIYRRENGDDVTIEHCYYKLESNAKDKVYELNGWKPKV